MENNYLSLTDSVIDIVYEKSFSSKSKAIGTNVDHPTHITYSEFLIRNFYFMAWYVRQFDSWLFQKSIHIKIALPS